MRVLFFTVLFFFLAVVLSLAGIYIYATKQLPYWSFEKNVAGLNDLSKNTKINVEENMFFKVSVDDPLDAINFKNTSFRNILNLVIEPQDDKITITNPDDGSQSAEQKLSEVMDKFLFSPLNNEIWTRIAQNRDYNVIENQTEWIFEINKEDSKEIFLNYFKQFDEGFSQSLIDTLSSVKIAGVSFEPEPISFDSSAKLEVSIDRSSYSINSVKLVVDGTYSVEIRVLITDEVLKNLPEEHKLLKDSLIQVFFDEVELTYTFSSFERLREFDLPPNPIQFWAEQVL